MAIERIVGYIFLYLAPVGLLGIVFLFIRFLRYSEKNGLNRTIVLVTSPSLLILGFLFSLYVLITSSSLELFILFVWFTELATLGIIVSGFRAISGSRFWISFSSRQTRKLREQTRQDSFTKLGKFGPAKKLLEKIEEDREKESNEKREN